MPNKSFYANNVFVSGNYVLMILLIAFKWIYVSLVYQQTQDDGQQT